MSATVTGTFQLIDRASGPMRRMEEQAKRTDKAMGGLGDSMDDFGTSKQIKQMDEVEKKLRDVDRAADAAGGTGGGLHQTSDALNMVDSRARSGAGGLNLFTGRLKFMVAAVVVALPYIIDLGGALGALVGSAGQAAAALGAFAVGGAGIAGVGLAGLMGVMVPAIKGVGQLKEGMDSLTEAQKQYGASSEQAVQAARDLRKEQAAMRDEGFAVNAAMKVLDRWTRFRQDWARATQSGQRDILGMMSDALGKGQNLLPTFARASNRSASGAADAVGIFLDRLDSPKFRNFITTMSELAEKWMPDLARAAANTGEALGNIALEVGPRLTRMRDDLVDMTEGWADSTSKASDFSDTMDTLQDQGRAWWRLLKASWQFTKQLFGSGADEGQTLVEAATAKLRDGTRWMRQNPQEMNNFWSTAIEGTRSLARLIGDLAPTIMDVADAMRPISRAIGDIVHFIASIKIGNINALTALLGVVATQRMAAGSGMIGGLLMGGRGARSGGQASPGILPLAAGGAGRIGAGAGRLGTAFRYGGLSGAATAASRMGLGSAAGSLATTGLRAVGKFAAPLAGLMALSDFLGQSGSVADKTRAAASGASFGLIPGPADPGEAATQLAGAKLKTPAELRAELALQQGRAADSGWAPNSSFLGMAQNEDQEIAQRKVVLLEKQLDLIKQQREEIERQNRMQRANNFLGQLDEAFATGSKLQGPEKAMDDLTNMAIGKMKGLGRDGKAQVAQNTLDWARKQAQSNPKLLDEFQELKRRTIDQFKGTERGVEIVNGRIYTGSKKEWQKIQEAIVGNAVEAQRETRVAFTRLQQDAVHSLTEMGYSPGDAARIVQAQESGTTGTAQERYSMDANITPPNRKKNATGSRLAGRGLLDNVGLANGDLGAPGELISNRHTEDRVNQMLGVFGTSLGKEVNEESHPHNMPRKQFALGGRQGKGAGRNMPRGGGGAVPSTGGVAQPPGDPGSEVVQAAYAGVVGAFLKRFNMDLTQGYNPGGPSVSPGHLSLDAAPSLDVVPLDGNWDGLFAQGLKWALAQGMQVGYDGQYGTQSWSNHGEGNHAHIDWGGDTSWSDLGGAGPMSLAAGIGAGVKAISLKRQKTNLKGIPGAMAQRGMDIQRKGMQDMINKKIGASGGSLGAVGAGLQSWNRIFAEHNSANGDWGGEVMPFNVAAQLAESAGLPGITFAQIAKGESGLRPGATGIDPGGTKGLGLWMITTGYNDALIAKFGGEKQMLNPFNNVQAAKSIYDSQGIGAWYGTDFMTSPDAHWTGGGGGSRRKKHALGGRVDWGGWFGQGTAEPLDFHRPTLIGVGDGGSETVSVTPKGSGRGGGGVKIGAIHIANHRDGDIKHQVKKEVGEAFRELSRELDFGFDSPEMDD